VVNGALVVEKEMTQMGKTAKLQHPIYFISEVLAESKKYYSEVEKICYAVVMSARKLRHYFEAHTIRVLTNQPLYDIFGNRDSSRRISKWVTELSEYIVNFEKRGAIKSQILVDFIAKWTEAQTQIESAPNESPWLVSCDGAWGNVGIEATTILISPSEIKLCYTARLQITNETNKCTNNIIESKAILLGLHKLRVIGVQTCVLCTDFKVVSGQIEKECIAKQPTLEKYLALVRRMENYFKGLTVEYIERNKNTEADNLAKATAHNILMPADVFFQVLEDASVKTAVSKPRLINIIEGEDWRAPIMAYLLHYYEPDSPNGQISMQ
jgi:ribonuclease HI